MSLSEEQKQEVIEKELKMLVDHGYLSEEDYKKVSSAYHFYKGELREPAETGDAEESKQQINRPPKKLKATTEPKPQKKKKKKTPEQIRERNITWSLILGVALLLLTGLVVATSNWDQMEAGMKVFSISIVSLFFLGLSYFTGKFLRIHQTAFAFLTLGSLLIPIVVVAIGYFELLGSYLSLEGEGRYALGLLGSLVPLPLYVRHAIAHRSRLFVWLSLGFSSLTVGFALGALPLKVDAFYLMIMMYNALLLTLYIRYRNVADLKLFIKEVPLYAQLNLILSTLLMLFFYESEVFYSFNLLLTAGLYMTMVFVYRTKEYQYVFSVMFVYAIYQLVENSPLHAIDSVIYAIVGLIYLGFAYALRDHTFLEKVFRYTSGVVSVCAFIYVSYESIILRGEEGSFLLLLAYLIVAVNYLILANFTTLLVFRILTPVFLTVSIWQVWELIELGSLATFTFFGSVILFSYIGVWTERSWLSVIKKSTFSVSLIVMLGCIGSSSFLGEYLESALMLTVMSIVAYFIVLKSEIVGIRNVALWAHPAALFFASVSIYPEIINRFSYYEQNLSIPFHFAMTGLLLLGLSVLWKKVSVHRLATAVYYSGQGVYLLAMFLLIPDFQVDPMVVQPGIMSVGIAVMYWLVKVGKRNWLWTFVSLATLGFYLSLLELLSIESFSGVLSYLIFGPLLLIGIGELDRKLLNGMRPYFYWGGHIILPFLTSVMIVEHLYKPTTSWLLFLIPLFIYLFSSLTAKKEWEVKAMLYATCFSLFILIMNLPLMSWNEEYAFLITSVILSVLWIKVSDTWKRRLEWYSIIFSILGVWSMIQSPAQLYTWEIATVIGYIVLILFFLHQRNWSIVRFIPLVMTVDFWERIEVWVHPSVFLFILAVCFVLLVGAGRYFHTYLFAERYYVDAYSWTALLYVAYIHAQIGYDFSVWIRIIPLLLVSVWLILNKDKWKNEWISQVFYTLGVLTLYPAYIMVLNEYQNQIPQLFIAELQVLPFIGVLVFLKKKMWSEHKSILNHIQLFVLLLIAGYLVIDAIQSHTIADAWVIGSLSLLSMVIGMQLKIKSYFFVGMGVLVFNVMYQTKPYWGNAPWWLYLLIAGLLLIGIASYNEWQKQQSNENNKPFETKVKRIWLALKRWD